MSTAIAARKPSTKPAEPDARRRAQQSRDHPDCRAATIKPSHDKIALALSSRRDNHPLAATAKMATLIVAAFPSRLSRYIEAKNPKHRWWVCPNVHHRSAFASRLAGVDVECPLQTAAAELALGRRHACGRQ